jgi:hypothetical protein
MRRIVHRQCQCSFPQAQEQFGNGIQALSMTEKSRVVASPVGILSRDRQQENADLLQVLGRPDERVAGFHLRDGRKTNRHFIEAWITRLTEDVAAQQIAFTL